MHTSGTTIPHSNGLQSSNLQRPPAWRVVIAQLTITQLLAVVLLALGQTSAALSASVGGWIAVVPNALFVLWAFRHSGARAARSIATDFYIGEALKMLTTVVGFVLAFQWVSPLQVGWLFGAYIAALSVYWISPWILTPGSAR